MASSTAVRSTPYHDETASRRYEAVLGIPTTDALSRPTDALLDMVFRAFPMLRPVPAVAAR